MFAVETRPSLSALTCSRPRRAPEVALRERPGVLAALRAELASLEVVWRDVDPPVQARDAGVVGSVEVARPLERHVLGRAGLVLQLAALDRPVDSRPPGK